jgi:hypothetical protein
LTNPRISRMARKSNSFRLIRATGWMIPTVPLSTRHFVTRMLTSLPGGSSMLRKFSGNSGRVDAAPRPIHEHRARTRQARERLWWLENRTHTDIFATELEQAFKVLTVLPGAGTPYPCAEVAGLRRMYLRKTACHIYYTFDEHEVIVRALLLEPSRISQTHGDILQTGGERSEEVLS